MRNKKTNLSAIARFQKEAEKYDMSYAEYQVLETCCIMKYEHYLGRKVFKKRFKR